MQNTAYSMMDITPTISEVMKVSCPDMAQGVPITEIVSSCETPARVAVLALDALGLFAWNLWRAEMPYLDGLHNQKTITLRSVMPTITPVNFATMVTGSDLKGHGVNTFKDPIRCESLFDTLRRANRRSAGVGLDGYTGSELLGRHADICGNAGDGSDETVAEKVMKIARGEKPDFIIAQFGKVDDYFHEHGPSSPQMAPLLRETDRYLEKTTACLKDENYAVIILADHGQHDAEADEAEEAEGLKGWHGSDRPEDLYVPCTWL